MAIDTLKTLEIIEVMENFVDKRRPPEHIRPKLDISYRIEELSVTIVEVRPKWDNPEIIRDHPVAKATIVKAKNCWKVFWLRADLKWHSYKPNPIVPSLSDFVRLVDEDKNACFWG
jgi:Protein of unknown function (DUF3024)